MLRTVLVAAACVLSTTTLALAAEPMAPSADYGKTVSIIGGCNDCHTADYSESNGVINPDTALTGNPVGYRGPWGTTYAANLRILAGSMTEDAWVKYLQTFTTRPPMPYYNVHALDEVQMRSLHMYIASLGAVGNPAPEYVPPGQEPVTPYEVFAPPTMPKQ
jgi:mono/diheme cytochrome c family protein